jgi:hypothetical protein
MIKKNEKMEGLGRGVRWFGEEALGCLRKKNKRNEEQADFKTGHVAYWAMSIDQF